MYETQKRTENKGLFKLIQSSEMWKICNENHGFSLQNLDLNPIWLQRVNEA